MAERPMPELEGVRHHWVRLPTGLRVHVAEAGEGPPLLLLHGWPQHWWMWKGVIPALAESHRVICADLRGQGWTDAPPWGYEKESLAADAVALLDALEIERVGLMGHDWGGYTGLLLCLGHPERIERLLALNTGHPLSDPSARRALGLFRLWYAALLGTPFAGDRLMTSGLVGRFMRGQLVPRVWSDEDARIYTDQFLEPARARAAREIYRTLLTRDTPSVLRGDYRGRRVRQPLLVLHGTEDPVLPVEAVADLPQHADDARVEPVEGITHFIVDEVPELVAERARTFFA
ncbi:MAG TPA: alpha/beta hydrolase [Thermoleophilaceae bacterium]|nr:alpha/beta hydrolase [Thermoleophilaceae bacterium]